MKKRLLKIVCFLLLGALLCPAIVYSIPADVRDISDSKYFDVVHESLEKAEESIYVSLYGIIVGEHDKLSLPYLLVQDLIGAHKRGVRVVVRLDKSYDYRGSKRTGKLSDRNDVAYLMLTGVGIDCKFAVQDEPLHDKLIVIDRKIVIEGSMNWSTSALRLNRESVTLIESEQYAEEKIRRIEGFESAGESYLDKAQIETVAVRNEFLRGQGLAGEMVRSRDEMAFDMYLLFLKDFKETGKARFKLDHKEVAKCFGMDLGRKHNYRRKINRALRRLKEKHKLIDCKFNIDKPAEVTLLDYEDKTKEYKNPDSRYISIPSAYWEYGWSRKLNLRSKFCYLINIYWTELSDTKPWWSYSQDFLAERFNVNKRTIMLGMRELRKKGLLEVECDTITNKGSVYNKDRKPNKYRLKPLLSQEEIDKKWQDLKNLYGERLVEKAREFAFMIDEGNSHEKAGSFITLIGRYGEDKVEKAVSMVARKKADNPTRHFGYIVGILKNWEEEGDID